MWISVTRRGWSYLVNNIVYSKQQQIENKLTSPLLKLSNGSMYRDETWYVCLLYHFHDDYIHVSMMTALFEKASGSLTLLLHSSNLLTVVRMEVKLGTQYIVSMMTTTT